MTYSVKQLSDLAGVSVRTLHYYDQIGLLKPSVRSEKGYRFYDRKAVLMLQQILFYRELGFSLKRIEEIIYDPGFNLVEALESHRTEVKKQAAKLGRLLVTIDKTIDELKNEKIMKDEEIYAGFEKEKFESMRKEVIEKWGEEQLLEAEERIRKMGKDGWNDAKKKGEEISQLLADLMDLNPHELPVQQAIALHFRHIGLFYEVSKERYLGLGKMYVEDERFREHYEQYGKGLAQFINEAIQVFCENGMKAS